MVLLAPLATACGPTLTTPERARQLATTTCQKAPPPQDELRAIDAMRVYSVKPAERLTYGSGITQSMGATMIIDPPRGTHNKAFGRMLRCHALRVLDGEVDPARIPNNPFFLDGSWVAVDMSIDEGSLIVTVSGENVSDNLKLVARAKAFAATHASDPVQ